MLLFVLRTDSSSENLISLVLDDTPNPMAQAQEIGTHAHLPIGIVGTIKVRDLVRSVLHVAFDMDQQPVKVGFDPNRL